jgi:hypothetical protein
MDQAELPVDDVTLRLGGKTGQETILAVEITRDGFEWALRHACLSSYVRGVHPHLATWCSVSGGDPESAVRLLPQEHFYPVGDQLLSHLRGLTDWCHRAAGCRRSHGSTGRPGPASPARSVWCRPKGGYAPADAPLIGRDRAFDPPSDRPVEGRTSGVT